jgi:hypothetical protein
MFDWIFSNRESFLGNYVEIGRNHLEAKTLQEEHNQFTIASNVSQILVNLVDQSTVISNVGIRIQWFLGFGLQFPIRTGIPQKKVLKNFK